MRHTRQDEFILWTGMARLLLAEVLQTETGFETLCESLQVPVPSIEVCEGEARCKACSGNGGAATRNLTRARVHPFRNRVYKRVC